MSIFKWTTEPKAIKIWIPHDDYSAMQWPCPSGFHVPLNTEWQTVYNIWTALWGWSSAWTNFWIALKLPFAGYRLSSNSKTSYQGSNGYYWSSRRYNADSAYNLRFGSSSFYTQTNYYRAYSLSVRWFKNSPVVPTSSWTKLYWTSIEAGWIFWSSSEWLISLSRNWQTWITIADKNLWATTVWNNGDTLSEANCWKYYQRWNNYWFPRTWGVTTSSVQVNASTYWPWNYYNSSTFITYNWRWDTTDNWNLWWWVTWVVHKADTDIKKVYLGTTKVRPIINFATQWPAPSGFHVPLNTERQDVYNVWIALGWSSSAWTGFWIALKLPLAGYRSYSNASVYAQGTDGYYWSSSHYDYDYAYFLRQSKTYNLKPQAYDPYAQGYSVRCFKNEPVIPTSSWTKLYWRSIASWWIFWNSTDWLISLSSNGSNWITIQDKNLWATQVWNSWNTLSQANCGKYYQWGNNYWFPRTWSVTTSSTRVNASAYWPWNYYSSSSFIKYNWSWDTAYNWNLRWWVSGNVPV